MDKTVGIIIVRFLVNSRVWRVDGDDPLRSFGNLAHVDFSVPIRLVQFLWDLRVRFPDT